MEEKVLIKFRNIVKEFDGTIVLKGINLDIYENEYTSLKKELAKATMALAPVQKPIDVDAISESLSLYPKLSDEGKKEFWSRILKKIIITQDDDFFIEPYSP